jgi:hypothetical protein
LGDALASLIARCAWAAALNIARLSFFNTVINQQLTIM